ncbi:GT4 family glycosyltransferase PelF [Tissierella sp. Yu-01]|uniref:GT4 family glycosyltransferase PelF n=1 Tax=Tissierella sp. Yu-01 TaxID=3035694 RepID=UPI00240E3171|nr:GT4 family glycosyltransferase PelF [Tissierella sp. Yu-01]WFA10151.1 GT4 family glycosyltransferase PelF [Tissierella sp. Yu-01]
MKVCIVAEGSYPYIAGGVSSWLHQLISNFKEHDFILITLMPDNKRKGKFVYDLPDNIVGIRELSLSNMLNSKGKWNKKIALTESDYIQLKNLLSFKKVEWDKLFNTFQEIKKSKLSGSDIQKSQVFYNAVQEAYMENFTHIPFTQVYWAFRSMYTIILELLLLDYPNADIYHSVSTGYAGLIGSYAAKLNKKSFILTEHGIYTREREEEIIKAEWVKGYLKDLWIKYFYQLSNCAYMTADKVISLFEYNKEIQVEIGCPREKISVIPNGINITNYSEIAEIVSSRKDVKEFSVGAVVRVVPIKDIITMLESFSIVNKDIDKVHFYIMGPTEEEPEYYKQCLKVKDNLRLENVSFVGRINIKDYFKKMNLLVLTSISEGQPLVILEGLASKLPFVATDVGDCKSLILGHNDEFGPAGRISKVMDSVSIAKNIIELLKNQDLRTKYGEAGYKRVSEKYRFEDFIYKYRELYTNYGLRD